MKKKEKQVTLEPPGVTMKVTEYTPTCEDIVDYHLKLQNAKPPPKFEDLFAMPTGRELLTSMNRSVREGTEDCTHSTLLLMR